MKEGHWGNGWWEGMVNDSHAYLLLLMNERRWMAADTAVGRRVLRPWRLLDYEIWESSGGVRCS